MSAKKTENLAEFEKQRQLILTGEYNSLFNDLRLNLPYRFLAYFNSTLLTSFIKDFESKLAATIGKFNGQDIWTFENIIGIIAPNYHIGERTSTLTFLKQICKVPEGHINFDRENNIVLSRYGMYLLTTTLLESSNSLENDLNTPLFKQFSETDLDESKKSFEDEMRLMFAKHYFVHPEQEWHVLMDTVQTDVRANQLRQKDSEATARLRTIVNKYMKYPIDEERINREIEAYRSRYSKKGFDDPKRRQYIIEELQKDFTEESVEIFKQTHIFDPLFQKKDGKTFKDQYENALESFDFEYRHKNPELPVQNKPKKWYNPDNVSAPNYPGAIFTPDLTFFMSWTINQFCDFIETEESKSKPRNKNKWFEGITNRFFSLLKEAFTIENINRFKGKLDFINCDKFINETQYREAYHNINKLMNGNGRLKMDRDIGEKIHENPGLLEHWKHQALYSKPDRDGCSDKDCVVIRKRHEEVLKKLHAEYLENPSLELAKQISEKEKDITFECEAFYGCNFQAYVSVPVTLNEDGEFVMRRIIMPSKPVTEFNLPLEKQDSLNPKVKQLGMLEIAVPYTIQPSKVKKVKPVKKPQFERIDFKKIEAHFTGQTLISFLEQFLKGGILRGKEYKRASLYPEDTDHGDSFSYNISNGKFADFASGQSGAGVISLVAYAKNLNRNNSSDLIEAAKFLADWAGGHFFTETYTPTPTPVVPKPKTEILVPPAGTPAPQKIWFIDQYYNIDQKWAYHNKGGIPIMYECRLNLPDGKKAVLPMKWDKWNDKLIWKSGAIPDNRPLYNLHMIEDYNIICISEGCKTADAVASYIKEALSTTWSGGSNAVKKTDWSPIKNKIVIIIPDADKKIAKQDMPSTDIKKGDLLPWELQPGQKAALEIANILQKDNIIHIVDTQQMANIKDGWDIADAQLEGWSEQQVRQFINIDNVIKEHMTIKYEK